MSGIERAVVLGALMLQALLIALGVVRLSAEVAGPRGQIESILMPTCFLLSVIALVCIARDLLEPYVASHSYGADCA